MNRIRRIAWVAGSALVTLLLTAAAPLGLGRGGEAAAQYAQPAATPAATPTTPAAPTAQPAPEERMAPAPAAGGKAKVPLIHGDYDVEELRRLVDIARESGFSDEQVKEITVEDAQGNVINAWEFLQAYDRRQREEAARIAAEQSKVYLAPKDIIKELDEKQPKDLNQLRDKMLFVE
jgi:hypothetical protein